MRKTVLIIGIILISLILSGNMLIKSANRKSIDGKIYYVDRSIQRLIPMDIKFGNKSEEKAAKEIIRKLIEGADYNYRILRLIPDDNDCMSVKVKDNTAVVNLKDSFIKNIPENKNHQILMLYSIVNSLTSINGIDTVEFLVNGKVEKISIGGIDMREVFIPDYYL